MVANVGVGAGAGVSEGLGDGLGVGLAVGQPVSGPFEAPGETVWLAPGEVQSLRAPATGLNAEGLGSELTKGTVMYDAMVVPKTVSMPTSA